MDESKVPNLRSWLISQLESTSTEHDTDMLTDYTLGVLKDDPSEKSCYKRLEEFLGSETEDFTYKLFKYLESKEALTRRKPENEEDSRSSERPSSNKERRDGGYSSSSYRDYRHSNDDYVDNDRRGGRQLGRSHYQEHSGNRDYDKYSSSRHDSENYGSLGRSRLEEGDRRDRSYYDRRDSGSIRRGRPDSYNSRNGNSGDFHGESYRGYSHGRGRGVGDFGFRSRGSRDDGFVGSRGRGGGRVPTSNNNRYQSDDLFQDDDEVFHRISRDRLGRKDEQSSSYSTNSNGANDDSTQQRQHQGPQEPLSSSVSNGAISDAIIVGDSSSTTRTSTLMVTNIPPHLNKIDMLNGYFKKFGEITNISIMKNEGKAFVQFKYQKSAYAAWSSTDAIMDNRFIKVFWSNKTDGATRSDGGGGGVLMPPPSLPYHMNQPSYKFPSSATVEQQQQQQKDAAKLEKAAMIMKTAQSTLEQQIKEQKELIEKISKMQDSEEKKQMTLLLKKLSDELKETLAKQENSLLHATKPTAVDDSKEKRKREVLDKDLDELVPKKLKPVVYGRGGFHSPNFAPGGGGVIGLIAARGKPHIWTCMNLDNRSTTLQVKSIPESHKSDKVMRDHFQQFGKVTDVIVDDSVGGFLVSFENRASAEAAMTRGKMMKVDENQIKLEISWKSRNAKDLAGDTGKKAGSDNVGMMSTGVVADIAATRGAGEAGVAFDDQESVDMDKERSWR